MGRFLVRGLMPRAKPTPERKSRSGSYVPNSLRGTVRVEIRCTPELAAAARHASESRDCTLAEILRMGVDAAMRLPKTPVESTMTAHLREQEEAAEGRADWHGED